MRGADPSCSTASLPSPARSRAERGRRGRADGTAAPRVDAAATRGRRATAARGEGRSSRNWSGSSSTRFAAASSSAISAASSSWGQPWRACQRRFGSHSAKASTVPTHSQATARQIPAAREEATARREPGRGEARGACSRARCRRPGPASSHWRSSPPPRIRVTTYTSVTQTSTSKVVVESRCPTAIAAPDAAVASAATACPARPAPSSRAIRATSTTTRAIATADSDPQSARVRAEHPLREAAEQRGQGRLIVVSPGGMARGDAEVQLVPVIAVTVRRRNEQQELGGCDRQYERPGDSIPPTTHAWADSIWPASQHAEAARGVLPLPTTSRSSLGGLGKREQQVCVDRIVLPLTRRPDLGATTVPAGSCT